MKVGLVIKDLKEATALGREIREYLAARGVEVEVEEASAARLGVRGPRLEEVEADLIVLLGGDGTILKTVAKTEGKEIPILGINFGTMGFLVEIQPKDWREALERVLRGDYTVEAKRKLAVRLNGREVGEALNEAVVISSMPVRMLHLQVAVDGEMVQDLRADGVIVSTPTGSTAYSYSAGGPILDPRVEGLVVTPICPFEPGIRPIVVPASSEIKVRLLRSKGEATIVVDGEHRGKVAPEGEVIFTSSGRNALFVKLGKDFYGRIRERFGTWRDL